MSTIRVVWKVNDEVVKDETFVNDRKALEMVGDGADVMGVGRVELEFHFDPPLVKPPPADGA